MSLFRKQVSTTAPVAAPEERAPSPDHTPVPGAARTLFNGPVVDFGAIYQASKLAADELDRVARAEELLHALPTTAPQTREVVEATLRAFGVDRTKIQNAAGRQLEALEMFVRYSHEQSQRVTDASAKRITELEAEIERCRQVSAQANREGEERARSVNDVLVKLQRVLEFFGDERRDTQNPELDDSGLDDDTMINNRANGLKPPPSGQSTTHP
jgi:hypothetical protein